MRIFIPLVLSSAILTTACTTTPPPPEIPVAEATSKACVDNLDWAYSAKRGAVTFNSSCAYCHKRNGRGQAGAVPALAGNTGLLADPDRGIRMLVMTQSHSARHQGMEYDDMIAILGELNSKDFADVLNYALSSWGNCAGPISPERVDAVAASIT